MPEFDLSSLTTPELVLGELIIIGLVIFGTVIIYNKILNHGKSKGREYEKVDTTRKTLAEHLKSCEDEKQKIYDKLDHMNTAIDTRIDGIDTRMTAVETKLDILLSHLNCPPNKNN